MGQCLDEISKAIRSVVWPPGATDFRFSEEGRGRGRGEGNGVVPIKLAFCSQLKEFGWNLETPLRIASRKNPGKLDATKGSPDGRLVAVEWETGNISSSHRAINKMVLGILKGVLCAGVLVLPTREMYRFLTDRIGNFEEISPYFDLWRAISIHDGLLSRGRCGTGWHNFIGSTDSQGNQRKGCLLRFPDDRSLEEISDFLDVALQAIHRRGMMILPAEKEGFFRKKDVDLLPNLLQIPPLLIQTGKSVDNGGAISDLRPEPPPPLQLRNDVRSATPTEGIDNQVPFSTGYIQNAVQHFQRKFVRLPLTA